MNFKKGDKVVCIEPMYGILKLGHIYEVSGDSYIGMGDTVYVTVLKTETVYARRFREATEIDFSLGGVMKKPKYKLGDTLVLVEDVEIDNHHTSKTGEYFKVREKRFHRTYDVWTYFCNDNIGFFFLESEVRECTKMDEVLGNEISSDRIQERE